MPPACPDWRGSRQRSLGSRCLSVSWPSRHLSFAFQGKVNVRLRRLLRLLDEAVQQDHGAAAHAENHPRDPVAVERGAHLPQALAEGCAMRSPNRPSEFDLLNILADRVAVG